MKMNLIYESIYKIKNISDIKDFIMKFEKGIQNDILISLNNLIENEDRIVRINDINSFVKEYDNIKQFGSKYRIITSKIVNDKIKIRYINQFEEDDRLSIIKSMSIDENKIKAYKEKEFQDETNKMIFIRLLDEKSRFNQLSILDSNLDKIIILSEFKDKQLIIEGLNTISDYKNLLIKKFMDGDFKLLSCFNEEILNQTFDSKQIKILTEYKKYTRESIKNHYSKYIIEHYDLLKEEDIGIIAQLILNIDTSNSEELCKQADSFIENVLCADDSLKLYKKIENIFLQNHLPYFAKVYLTFLTVHPNFDSYYFENSNNGIHSVSSPILNRSSLLHKKVIVLTDLIKCNIETNNIQFINYLDKLEYGNILYCKYKDKKESISEKDKSVLEEFRESLFTIYDNTLFKRQIVPTDDIINDISNIEEEFLKIGDNNYTLADRIISSYCHFIGINTISDARKYIYNHIESRNEESIKRIDNNDFSINEGDFIKSFDINYFIDMIQNGIVAKDYLGAEMNTDMTALDTDLSRVYKDTTGMSISDIINLKDKDTGYFGQGYIIIKDNPKKINITKKSNNEPNSRVDIVDKKDIFSDKLEAFSNGTGSNISNPYGIRTGFSASKIDFIVFDEQGGYYSDNIYKLILPMVMYGIYIPIISKDMKILFDKTDFKNLRYKLNGISHYGINDYILSDNIDGKIYRDIASKIDDSTDYISNVKNKIINAINEGLEGEYSVITYINGKLNKNELQVLDTGSTGRQTNIPYDGDYDFVIRINRDIDINDNLENEFIKKIISKFDVVEPGRMVYGDIKEMIIKIDGKEYHLDLSFTRKTDKLSYSSEMCVSDRLNTIKELYPDKYRLVLANIIYAKKFFKENECYKKGQYGQGGLGGIGVENWILQNGGSFYDAAFEFLSNAYDENGNIVDYDSFIKKYYIWDFGENFYTERKNEQFNYHNNLHDNFIKNNLTRDGYEKICKALKKFVNNYQQFINNEFEYENNIIK